MDKIKIENLHLYAFHGVHAFEKEKGQNFYINAILHLDTSKAGVSDNLADTVSYSDVCKLFDREFKSNKYDLIEKAAEALAKAALYNFSAIRAIEVEVRKPEAPIGLEVESVSVYITREWKECFLAIGSNMGDKKAYINQAIEALNEDENIRVLKVSDIIETKPYGGVEQDMFLNGAIRIETIYNPFELLDRLHQIEKDCDRVREIHWGPRTLDLDILLFSNEIINTEKLIIPHIDMANRDFVLIPLKQIDPQAVHPVEHISISRMYDEYQRRTNS